MLKLFLPFLEEILGNHFNVADAIVDRSGPFFALLEFFAEFPILFLKVSALDVDDIHVTIQRRLEHVLGHGRRLAHISHVVRQDVAFFDANPLEGRILERAAGGEAKDQGEAGGDSQVMCHGVSFFLFVGNGSGIKGASSPCGA